MIRFFKKFFFAIILNISAILFCQKLLNYFLNDFYFKGTIEELILFAVILSLLNLLIKPILRFLFLPLIWITLGFFTLFINIILLKTASYFIPVLIVKNFTTWLAAAIIISIFNSFVHWVK